MTSTSQFRCLADVNTNNRSQNTVEHTQNFISHMKGARSDFLPSDWLWRACDGGLVQLSRGSLSLLLIDQKHVRMWKSEQQLDELDLSSCARRELIASFRLFSF